MASATDRSLSEADKEMIFRKATAGLPRKYAVAIKTGMSDAELEAALKSVLGIFGGSGGPDQLSIAYAGSGLRIWGSWSTVNTVRDKPLFSSRQTIAVARQVYGIADPDNDQLHLF